MILQKQYLKIILFNAIPLILFKFVKITVRLEKQFGVNQRNYQIMMF